MWAGKLLGCKSVTVLSVEEERHIFKSPHPEGD